MFRARLDWNWKRKNPMERKQSKFKFSSLFQFPSNLYIYIYVHFIESVFSFHLKNSTSQGYPEDLRIQIHLNPLQQNQDETSFRFSATHAKSHHPSHFLKSNSFFGELNMWIFQIFVLHWEIIGLGDLQWKQCSNIFEFNTHITFCHKTSTSAKKHHWFTVYYTSPLLYTLQWAFARKALHTWSIALHAP